MAKETKYFSDDIIGAQIEYEYGSTGNLTKEIYNKTNDTIYEWREYEYITITSPSGVIVSKPE